jgi:hypothetical protein
MNNIKYVSRLILIKSRKYLKISILLFALSLMLMALFLAIIINQYLQVKNDFINNDNIHIIEISTLQTKTTSVRELNFDDIRKIREIIKEYYENIDYFVFNVYQLNFGIESNKNEILFLYGVDDYGARLLGLSNFELFHLYSSELIDDITVLKIPIIDIHEDGLSSSETIEMTFINVSGIPKITPISIYESISNQTYISLSTYQELIKTIYGVTWESFIKNYNSKNEYGIQAIYKIFIYVEDITKVERIAKIINDYGYTTNYTFKSFTNFDNSIKNTSILSALLIIVILFITSGYIILSINSYLKVQQKDMGILKHHGYNYRSIKKIYEYNINKKFIYMALYMFVFIIIISFIFIKDSYIIYTFIICICIYIPMYIINRILSCYIITRYAKLEIIDLIKANKEFE